MRRGCWRCEMKLENGTPWKSASTEAFGLGKRQWVMNDIYRHNGILHTICRNMFLFYQPWQSSFFLVFLFALYALS